MTPSDHEALILDRAIDLMLAGGRAEGDPLIDEAADVLALVAEIPMSELARDDARRRMFAKPPRRLRRRVLWIAGVAAACIVSLASVAAAARNALPGDALFGLRRSAQSTKLVLTFSAPARASAQLARAQGDLAAARVRAAEGHIHEALDALGLFRTDLAAARREIATVSGGEGSSLDERANMLEQQADAFERGLTVEQAGVPDDGDSRSGATTGSDVEGRSGDRVDQPSSGDSTTQGSHEGDVSASSSPDGSTSISSDGGSGDGGHDGSSASPSPTTSSGSDGGGSGIDG